MDVTKWMMAGVVGIGLYAVYRMGHASSQSEPAAPGEPGGLAKLGDPLSLKYGQYYRGRLDLSASTLAPFSADASDDAIQKALTTLGFSNVTVWSDPGQLPADWPATEKDSGQGTKFFEAMWNGPRIQLPRPAAIKSMWMTQSPQLAAARAQTAGYAYR